MACVAFGRCHYGNLRSCIEPIHCVEALMFLVFNTRLNGQIGIRCDKILCVKSSNDLPKISIITYSVTNKDHDEIWVKHSVADVIEAINMVYKNGW